MTPVGLTTCPSGIGVNFAPFSTCAEYTRHSALISVCIASTDSALSLLANCRSISRASRIASFESSFCGTSLGFAGATFAAAFGLPLAVERRDLAAALGDDIKLVSLFHQLVFPQLQLPVGDAFAGLHVVFHAVPGADEVHLGVREIEPLRCLVGTQPLLDLGDGETLAGRAALMQAEIAVGVELAFMPEYADLVLTGENDAAIAVLELRDLTDELLGHADAPSCLGLEFSGVGFRLYPRFLAFPSRWLFRANVCSAKSAPAAIRIIQLFESNQRQAAAGQS